MAGNRRNGAIECSEAGFDGLTRGPSLRLRCGLGEIIAYQAGDRGVYDEIGIDLVADDGRVLQLAVVGCCEGDELGDEPRMHVYAYDGLHEDVAHGQDVTVGDESFWY